MALTRKKSSMKATPKKKSVTAKSLAPKKTKPSRVVKKKAAVKSAAIPKKKVAAKKTSVRVPAVNKVKTQGSVIRKASARKAPARPARKVNSVNTSVLFAPQGEEVRQTSPQKKRAASVSRRKVLPVSPVALLPEEEQAPVQPVRPAFFQEVQGVLPAGYGDHFITLMICSPYQLYTYWEIQKHQEASALQLLGGSWDQVKSILRVYNLTKNSQGTFFTDIELGGGADCWFINAEPDQSYRVEIGLRHADGRYIMLARSNDVTTPRAAMSDVLDEEWMGIDFEHMYTLSGGFEPGCSSATLRRLMEERLRSGDTSGSGMGMLSSGSLVKKKERHFWFTLNCELIVYGATAPDAQVTMNGQAVKLRPDGTFTLRYSLPDGKMRLEAKAISSDLIEERTITPTVQRNTERPEPVIRRDRGRG